MALNKSETNLNPLAAKQGRVRLAWKGLRWILLFCLCLFALGQAEKIWTELKQRDIDHFSLVLLVLVCSSAYLVQGLLTQKIASYCNCRIPLLRSAAINLTGAMWSLIMPMGAMGYKMIYLKQVENLPAKKYLAYYGLSFLASLPASFILLLISSLLKKDFALSAISSSALLLIFFIIHWVCKGKGSLVAQVRKVLHLDSSVSLVNFSTRLLVFLKIHLMGNFLYVVFYSLSFRALGFEVGLEVLLFIVGIQSLLFLVNIVPGNLILLEAMVGWAATWQGIPLWTGVLASSLLRFCLLSNLAFLGAIAIPLMPKLSSLKDKKSA